MGFYLSKPGKIEVQAHLVRNDSEGIYNNSRKITERYNSFSWKDNRCFLIGGGPSLKGFDFNRLKGEKTIGTNRTFEFYSCDINYSMDIHLYDWIHNGELSDHAKDDVTRKWRESTCDKVFLTPVTFPRPSFGPEVMLLKRLDKVSLSLSLEDGVYSGGNSGFGALQLACALGCKEIYLLGYDMKVTNSTHWHSGYKGQGSLSDAETKLISFREQFHEFYPFYTKLGIQVYNCSSDSALTCFPNRNIDEVLPVK